MAAVKSAYLIQAPELCQALSPCMTATDSTLRLEATRSLSVANDPNVFPPLLAALHDTDANVRAEAANGLRYRVDVYNAKNPHAEVVQPLAAALADSDARVRKSSAEALGHLERVKKLPTIEKQAAVAALISQLSDDDAEVAGAAIESLAMLGDPQAVEPIMAVLANKKLAAKAIVALADFHDPRAVKPLRAQLSEKDPQVISSLGKLKDRESVDAIIALLDDKNDRVRQTAAQALGAIRDPRAVEPLVDHLTKNGQVVHDVARGIGEIKDPRAIGPLIDAARKNGLRIGGFDRVNRDPNQNPVAWPLFYLRFYGDRAVGRCAEPIHRTKFAKLQHGH